MHRQLERLRAAELKAQRAAQAARKKADAATAKMKARAERQLSDERKRYDDRLRKYQKSIHALRNKNEDLERRIKLGETAQSEGLLEEGALLAFLEENFSDDVFDHTGKGGDIIHDIRSDSGAKAGRIVYEIKTGKWSGKFIKQCAAACVSREADVAILVTQRFPTRRPHYFVERGVLVISPLALLPLVHTARNGLLSVYALKISGDGKKKAVRAVFDYLAGGQYTEHMRRVGQHLKDLHDLLQQEQKSHRRNWATRELHHLGIAGGVAIIHDRLRALLLPVADDRAPLPPSSKALLPSFPKALPRASKG